VLAATANGWAQTKDKSTADKKPSQAEGLEGTPVKRAPANNDDSIVRLAVAPAQKQGAMPGATKESNATPEDGSKRAAEIASLEKQIQDKQGKILLLMQLFVNDEQGFLRDPGGQQADPEVKERRQSEQNELHTETAQLAQLKARLNELTGAR
jgi:hypothetical protein